MKEVIKGSDAVIDCSYDSFPKPTKVYWKTNNYIVNTCTSNTFRTKYNGSSGITAVLVIHDTNANDAGKYLCVVENSIGAGYSKTLQLVIKGKSILSNESNKINQYKRNNLKATLKHRKILLSNSSLNKSK